MYQVSSGHGLLRRQVRVWQRNDGFVPSDWRISRRDRTGGGGKNSIPTVDPFADITVAQNLGRLYTRHSPMRCEGAALSVRHAPQFYKSVSSF